MEFLRDIFITQLINEVMPIIKNIVQKRLGIAGTDKE